MGKKVRSRKPASPAQRTVGRYLRCTRSYGFSFLSVVPLLVFYEVLCLVMRGRHRSVVHYLADALLDHPMQALGGLGVFLWGSVVIGVFVFLGLWGLRRSKQPIRPLYLPIMVGEGGVWAILLGLALNAVPPLMVAYPNAIMDTASKVAAAIHAGVYEELVFRVLLLGTLVLVFTRVRSFPRWASYFLALLISSIAFAVAHYFSLGRAPFDRHVFLLRQIGGVCFGLIYCLRGFGIAAYTHTLYDLFVSFS